MFMPCTFLYSAYKHMSIYILILESWKQTIWITEKASWKRKLKSECTTHIREVSAWVGNKLFCFSSNSPQGYTYYVQVQKWELTTELSYLVVALTALYPPAKRDFSLKYSIYQKALARVCYLVNLCFHCLLCWYQVKEQKLHWHYVLFTECDSFLQKTRREKHCKGCTFTIYLPERTKSAKAVRPPGSVPIQKIKYQFQPRQLKE